MKKTYQKPCMEQLSAECSQMMAVSLLDGSADSNAEVLTKENNDWDIWEE